MSEKEEIIFMQTRLIRLASEEWHLPVEKVIELLYHLNVAFAVEGNMIETTPPHSQRISNNDMH